jgi:hypothetical protein
MRASLGKTNNGDISATLSVLKYRGWTSPTTLASALYELQALGFLERVNASSAAVMQRKSRPRRQSRRARGQRQRSPHLSRRADGRSAGVRYPVPEQGREI